MVKGERHRERERERFLQARIRPVFSEDKFQAGTEDWWKQSVCHSEAEGRRHSSAMVFNKTTTTDNTDIMSMYSYIAMDLLESVVLPPAFLCLKD